MLMRKWRKQNTYMTVVEPNWSRHHGNQYEVCHKMKKNRTKDSAIPFVGIYLKDSKLAYLRDTCIPIRIAALVYNGQPTELA